MKRILVIDESEVTRETLGLILARDFVVLKRPPVASGEPFALPDRDIDLLILGVTPKVGAETSRLARLAAQSSFAVLLLVDSQSQQRLIEEREQLDCLAKPFNPYELIEKVEQLLARRSSVFDAPRRADAVIKGHEDVEEYCKYPFLSRTTETLLQRFAMTRLPVLIFGEVGCGQRLVARALQRGQGSRGAPILVNAAELSAALLSEKSLALSAYLSSTGETASVIVENLDNLSPAGQSLLLNFIEAEETKVSAPRFLATARVNLLDQVYRGQFAESLYYKLATLTLELTPLRDRREDIPALAHAFARRYSRRLGLDEAVFSPEALVRLSNYLWFGNLRELETVIARTLVTHGKGAIEASDLVFDFFHGRQLADKPEIEEAAPAKLREVPSTAVAAANPSPGAQNGAPAPAASDNGRATSAELRALIHELAHELKNPMVTIKTFAQLLTDRYQDEDFRARFREVVGGDIDRMDNLLEAMIEFANFPQPRASNLLLEQKLQSVLDEIGEECARRRTAIRWKGNGPRREIRTDEAQLRYILRNALVAVLSQAETGSEIEIDAAKQGAVTISYARAGGRLASLGRYFSASLPDADENCMPIRILLAKQLVERNGGTLALERSNEERDILRIKFPIA